MPTKLSPEVTDANLVQRPSEMMATAQFGSYTRLSLFPTQKKVLVFPVLLSA